LDSTPIRSTTARRKLLRAARILVVHDGRIAEEGTHDELLARGGQYARLYRLQMMGHAAAPPRSAGSGLDAAE
jgi:ABC-type transport system involved in cytochrome bd biosynthesis fused ATPase/permease subunit